jgi:hypothetical protein
MGSQAEDWFIRLLKNAFYRSAFQPGMISVVSKEAADSLHMVFNLKNLKK